MSELNRRDFAAVMAAFSLLGTLSSSAEAAAQSGGGPAAGTDGKLSKSVVFGYDSLTVKQNANGGSSRQVLSGYLPTGEFVEMHETSLPAGKMPHPPHQHAHSEFLLIRDGQLEFINEGQAQPVGPGGVVFTASNRMHGLRNVGTTMANYFVVAVGVQTKES